MKKFGLLGRKLSHSYSPQIHSMLGDYTYPLYEIEPECVEGFVKQADFGGINVTIPYKKVVAELCDELTDVARRLGSVNTVVKRGDGSLLGHNTDYYGFSHMVKKSGVSVAGKKAIVLGNGGACPTVCAVLQDMGASSVTVISRSGDDNYENISRHYDSKIIVNTTPVGMFPNNGAAALSVLPFNELEAVFDLIYNPERTVLMLECEALGIKCASGLSMLVAQAKESAEYFLSKKISESRIDEICTRLHADMRNIVLIGMPGCGKSTVGELVAKELGREYIDADEYLVRKIGKAIPEIFAEEGNSGFRKHESAVLAELGTLSNKVIATGGGCVTVEENYAHLHQNSLIVRINRDLSLLAREGRPLSLGADLSKMFAERAPMYERFADVSFENNGSAEECAKRIVRFIYEDTCN